MESLFLFFFFMFLSIMYFNFRIAKFIEKTEIEKLEVLKKKYGE